MIELGEKWTKNKVESSSKNKQFSIMIDHKMFGPKNNNKKDKKNEYSYLQLSETRFGLVEFNKVNMHITEQTSWSVRIAHQTFLALWIKENN